MTKVPFRDLKKRFRIGPNAKVLEVGGSARQLDEIPVHTQLDFVHPTEFPHHTEQKLLAKNFVRVNLSTEKFPFKDNEFDFVFCSHTLEDLYDPRNAISEMGRVAKKGLFLTPTRGSEMEYTRFDVTDWLTGGNRLPGRAHHYWLFEIKGKKYVMTPKHYPLLYSPEFQYTKWNGPYELEYFWTGKPNFEIFSPLNFREMIKDYRDFVNRNKKLLVKGRTHYFVDKPRMVGGAYFKKLRKIGYAYTLK